MHGIMYSLLVRGGDAQDRIERVLLYNASDAWDSPNKISTLGI